MNEQTITMAQARTAEPDSLWHFLASLPATMEAQLLYGMILSGLLGMLANYTVKWAKNEIAGCLGDYLIRSHLRATVLSFTIMVGSAITAIAAGMFTTAEGAFVGWGTVLWLGVTNGFAVDAIANKGHREPTEGGKP